MKIVFKAYIYQDMQGREHVKRPSRIQPWHVPDDNGPVLRYKVRKAERDGLIPERIFMDDLPEHIKIKRLAERNTAEVTINI